MFRYIFIQYSCSLQCFRPHYKTVRHRCSDADSDLMEVPLISSDTRFTVSDDSIIGCSGIGFYYIISIRCAGTLSPVVVLWLNSAGALSTLLSIFLVWGYVLRFLQ